MSLAADVENIRVRESAALSLAALERFQPRPPRSQSGPAKSRPPPRHRGYAGPEHRPEYRTLVALVSQSHQFHHTP